MNAIEHGVLYAVATALTASVAGEVDWQEFRSEEGNFLLWVPAKPEELKVAGCPPGAKVWQASGDSLLTLFQFGFIGRQKPMDEAGIEAFLDGLAAENAETLKGTVLSTKKVTLSRWPGRETRIAFSAAGIKMCLLDRVFLVKDTKLFVRLLIPEERSAHPENRKILDSFKLIDESRVARE
jgi:hypothetical protein